MPAANALTGLHEQIRLHCIAGSLNGPAQAVLGEIWKEESAQRAAALLSDKVPPGPLGRGGSARVAACHRPRSRLAQLEQSHPKHGFLRGDAARTRRFRYPLLRAFNVAPLGDSKCDRGQCQ